MKRETWTWTYKIVLASSLTLTSGVLWGASGVTRAFAGSAYGVQISATASAPSQWSVETANHVVDNSGMSGTGGKAQFHDNSLLTMWRTKPRPGQKNWIEFDLGAIYPLGQMWIWNYNDQDTKHPKLPLWMDGLRNVRIYTSVDKVRWTEFKGAGYPFQLAPGNGSAELAATNLNDGKHTPVNFGGMAVRYVKIVPDVRAGIGNWQKTSSESGKPGKNAKSGATTSRDVAFGLSAVRFYTFSPIVENHTLISATATAGSEHSALTSAMNLTNNNGMSGSTSPMDTHDNRAEASDMWESGTNPGDKNWVQFDLGGTYPIGKMLVWNYNQRDPKNPSTPLWNRGLKDVQIEYSLDGTNWTELKGTGYPYQFAPADGSASLWATNLNDGHHTPVDFGGVEARYVRIVPEGGAGQGNWGGKDGHENVFGLSAVRFYATKGYVVEPAPQWTSLFSQYNGWTGADGIFSIPLDGRREPGDVTSSSHTLFEFGDTFIGSVDATTKNRSNDLLIHNTLAMLTGKTPDPNHIQFTWSKDQFSIPQPVFQPSRSVTSDTKAWYWLQDGVASHDTLYLFPLLLTQDPTGAAGFQFKVVGVSEITAPIHGNQVDTAHAIEMKTNLFVHPKDNSGDIMFGAGIMANTKQAGAPHPDGYVYVYGYKNEPSGLKNLVVARTRPNQMTNMKAWRFWDGTGWSTNPETSAPLLDGVSPELSVTPIVQGSSVHYTVVYEKNAMGNLVEMSSGTTPTGPFQAPVPLYATTEQNSPNQVFTYNAKAHAALSPAGQLLISYNVNTTNGYVLNSDADIYRPRFVVYRRIQ